MRQDHLGVSGISQIATDFPEPSWLVFSKLLAGPGHKLLIVEGDVGSPFPSWSLSEEVPRWARVSSEHVGRLNK